ncbi:MAG: pilus assembly FimT family protein [Thermodesulfobacteriota bacterium]
MKLLKKKKGYTVIEVMIVAGVMALLVVMAGSLSGTFALRRTVDDIANRITSELNITKLKASRDGVQYRTLINFDSTEHKINIKSVRGDSNRTATFDPDDPVTEQEIKIMADYEIIPSSGDIEIDFNPNGTATTTTSLAMRPLDADNRVAKCANITVSRFGQISTLIGKWDGTDCKPIFDKQEQF